MGQEISREITYPHNKPSHRPGREHLMGFSHHYNDQLKRYTLLQDISNLQLCQLLISLYHCSESVFD